MRRSVARALAAPYQPTPQPADVYKDFAEGMERRRQLGNRPPCEFEPGDRVTIGGRQEFNVMWSDWSEAAGDYMVHGRFGPCKFYMWAKDVRHAR